MKKKIANRLETQGFKPNIYIRRFLIIFSCLFTCILFLIIVLMLLIKKNVNIATKPINRLKLGQKIDTSQWESYENKMFGFKFSYPQNWKLQPYNLPTHCPGNGSNDYSCRLIDLNPQAYIDYQRNKYNGFVSSLVYLWVFQDSNESLESLYKATKIEYSSQVGFESKPSIMFRNNGILGFFVNQKTDSSSDNIFVVELTPKIYIKIINRESDKHYTPGGKVIDDQNDYTKYTPIVNQIIKTISPLN